MGDVEIKGLFPTPFMRVGGLLSSDLIQECIKHICAADTEANFKSALLRHSGIVEPEQTSPYREVTEKVNPYLVQFGTLLFGEELEWSVKEIWTNLLQPGGQQAIHSHSNSFISGVVYLTESHPSARTVFHRGIGGREFIFSNENKSAEMGPFNANKWVSPTPHPGDLILFPSYMLHEVPRNEGGQRMTIALNAIPDRLDSWGYSVRFTSNSTV
jgi:uncharacterized protein (TIGR02466 family)